jgi:hypothetical protein
MKYYITCRSEFLCPSSLPCFLAEASLWLWLNEHRKVEASGQWRWSSRHA